METIIRDEDREAYNRMKSGHVDPILVEVAPDADMETLVAGIASALVENARSTRRIARRVYSSAALVAWETGFQQVTSPLVNRLATTSRTNP
jgi:hypothetical protein